jgi:hypothetical protein
VSVRWRERRIVTEPKMHNKGLQRARAKRAFSYSTSWIQDTLTPLSSGRATQLLINPYFTN